jgi:hypothetical protein
MRTQINAVPLLCLLMLCVGLAIGHLGCGGSSASTPPPPPGPAVTVTVSPASARVEASGTQQFTATLTGTSNTAVIWSLSGCTGADCGTVSPAGLYAAPSVIPTQATVTVTATSQADPTKFATAAVNDMPIEVSIAPAGAWAAPGATLQFTSSVRYDPKDAGVIWALPAGCSAATCGALSSVTATSVTYTAPATVPNPPTVTLTATSVTDPSQTAQTTITISGGGGINTWYVDGVNGNDNNDCKSWQHACKTIGHAISRCSSGDSVMVAAATYTENLAIGSSLNILGADASTTIVDGGGRASVVTVSNSNANVTLSQLTIRNGSAQGGGGLVKGGGIYNVGTLTVNYSTISGNKAINGFVGLGGGIYNSGTATISNTTLNGNHAFGSGGGIDNDSGGRLTINNSTISGNSATGYTGGSGGGISNGGNSHGGSATINNSTITGNDAMGGWGGGIYAGPVTFNNSTISGNSANTKGSGIDGTATLQNTIVANNSGGNCDSTMTSNGYNLSSDNTCSFNGSGDMNNTDPKLGTLGNYGGPTQTISLLSDSPAIDAGNPSGCTDSNGHLLATDQRGQPRPDSEDTGGCDMGAYESQSD